MLINTQELYEQELAPFLQSSNTPIAVDTETNITDRYQDRFLLGISLAKDDRIFYIPIGHDSWMDTDGLNLPVPKELYRGVQAELVFFNAKFDLHVLKKAGIIIPDLKIYDVMLMCHLIDENEFQYSLDMMGLKYLNVRKERDLAKEMKKDWLSIPAPIMAKYAEQDARMTLELYNHLKEQFTPYEEVWNIDEKFLLLLQQMEQKGIPVNVEVAKELQLRCEKRLQEIENELGIDIAKPSQLHRKLFDAPPIGFGIKVTQRTPNGKPQVNTRFLETCNHPAAGLILEWREIQKQLTSYYNPYITKAEGYGRIHADFQQHGTVTGRLSCKNPNLQQIPRDAPVKKLFLAESGKQLWEIDFRTIEMRLAMVYADETKMLEIFKVDGDVHQATADDLKVTRQQAKVINFLIIYGGGANALSAQLNLSLTESKKILDRYRAAYPKLFRKMNEATAAGEQFGEVKLWSGRKRHFKWPSEAHKGFNSIIQGGAFEIVKRSMLRLREAGFDIRSQVHDSVWIMVNNEAEVKEAEKIMSDWTEELFGLKFSVESKRLN